MVDDLDLASAPCGSYPLDTTYARQLASADSPDRRDDEKFLTGSGGISVWIDQNNVRKRYLDPEFDLKRVLRIIYAAGDCSVSTLGRVYNHDNKIVAYLMPIEKVIKSPFLSPYYLPKELEFRFFSKEERLGFIDQLVALVDRLHSLKIIHGDVKVQNLLMCSDGKVRFCDFDDAHFEDENFVRPNIFSAPYASWRRCLSPNEPPTYAEDKYAMGMVIYEIYTGTVPLGDGIPQADLEDSTGSGLDDAMDVLLERSALGLWPNLSLVDDLSTANLIRRCLEGCLPPPNLHKIPEYECIETFTGFRDCRTDPVHAYSRVLHCADCPALSPKTGAACKAKFYRPSALDLSLSPRCPHCNEGVSWTLSYSTLSPANQDGSFKDLPHV